MYYRNQRNLLDCGDKPRDAGVAHNHGESYGGFDSHLRYQILEWLGFQQTTNPHKVC
jgi:hypothetical protein